jgi:hypothetical protein
MAETARFTLPDGLDELRDLLMAEWPARRSALRASGIPLMEGDPDPDPDLNPDPDPDSDPTPAPDPADPPVFDAAYVKKLRDEAARHRREAREAQARVKEFEDKDKSESERLEERATAAEARATSAEKELMRTRVALNKGLTDAQAKRLIGDTEEELEADADELLASFNQEHDDGQDPLRRPTERLRPGAVPTSEPEESDPAVLASKVRRRF